MRPELRRAAGVAPTPLPPNASHVWGRRLQQLAAALDRPAPALPAAATAEGSLTRPTGLGSRADRRRPTTPGASSVVGAGGSAPDWLAETLPVVLTLTDREHVWLALAVLTGALPDDGIVEEISREAEFSAGRALADAVRAASTPETLRWQVRVARGETLVDVSQTLGQPYTTGIQRVVRETAARWMTGHGALPVAWTGGFESIRACTPEEIDRVARKAPAPPEQGALVLPAGAAPDLVVLVPWEGAYLTGEVLAERVRSNAVRGLARYARCRTGAIGYDCVPIACAETLIEWAADTYSWHLAAMRHVDQIAAISEASAREFRGWRAALAGQGRTGPAIDAVLLPDELAEPTAADLAVARGRFLVADLPLVLVVGSTEPRKNHLAILHAAELLWRDGVEFSLSFVGGRRWGSDEFGTRLGALQQAGRPVDIVSGVGDGVLAAAYRLARFTVFPSLSEGYGLPVAESLANGTPAVTSCYGSMAEIAAGGGALLVDPRDDHDLAAGMRSLLRDDDLLAQLREQAARRPTRTWDRYADHVWHLLMGTPPDESD